MSLLSDKDIKKCLKQGSIVISPFDESKLNASSYDLELGPYFYRYEEMVDRRPAELKRGEGFQFVDATLDGGISIAPQERILGHTVEFAGGTVSSEKDGKAVTTEMSATSTAGRHGISACLCARLGSPNYINRWTLEIINHGPSAIWLPVGAIICQLSFFEIDAPSSTSSNYQSSKDLDELKVAWSPRDMLPKALKVKEAWKTINWSTTKQGVTK